MKMKTTKRWYHRGFLGLEKKLLTEGKKVSGMRRRAPKSISSWSRARRVRRLSRHVAQLPHAAA